MTRAVDQQVTLVDGDCRLVDPFLDVCESGSIQQQLIAEVDWKQPIVTLFGRQVPSPRLAAWYGDPDAVYRYSGLGEHAVTLAAGAGFAASAY